MIFENKELEALTISAGGVFDLIDKTRRIRNVIAHSTVQNLHINGKCHVRLTAPAFDVINLGRKIAQRQVPGLTASDLRQGIKTARAAIDLAEGINRVFEAFYNGRSSLPQKFLELERDLQTFRESVRGAQTPKKSQPPPQPSDP